jgi:hypothetical protein
VGVCCRVCVNHADHCTNVKVYIRYRRTHNTRVSTWQSPRTTDIVPFVILRLIFYGTFGSPQIYAYHSVWKSDSTDRHAPSDVHRTYCLVFPARQWEFRIISFKTELTFQISSCKIRLSNTQINSLLSTRYTGLTGLSNFCQTRLNKAIQSKLDTKLKAQRSFNDREMLT